MVKVSKNKLRGSHRTPRAELCDLFAVVHLLYSDAKAFFQKTLITHTCAVLSQSLHPI